MNHFEPTPPSTTHNPNSSETSRKSPRLLDLLLNLHLPPYPPIPNYLKFYSFTHHHIPNIYQVSIVIVVRPTTRNTGGSLKPPSPKRFQAPTEPLLRLLEAPPEALLRCDSVESRCSRDSRDTAMLEMARRRSSTSERRRRRDKGFLWLGFGWFWMVLDGFGWFWMVLDDFGWFWMVLARWRLGEEFLGILDHERLMVT